MSVRWSERWSDETRAAHYAAWRHLKGAPAQVREEVGYAGWPTRDPLTGRWYWLCRVVRYYQTYPTFDLTPLMWPCLRWRLVTVFRLKRYYEDHV